MMGFGKLSLTPHLSPLTFRIAVQSYDTKKASTGGANGC